MSFSWSFLCLFVQAHFLFCESALPIFFYFGLSLRSFSQFGWWLGPSLETLSVVCRSSLIQCVPEMFHTLVSVSQFLLLWSVTVWYIIPRMCTLGPAHSPWHPHFENHILFYFLLVYLHLCPFFLFSSLVSSFGFEFGHQCHAARNKQRGREWRNKALSLHYKKLRQLRHSESPFDIFLSFFFFTQSVHSVNFWKSRSSSAVVIPRLLVFLSLVRWN